MRLFQTRAVLPAPGITDQAAYDSAREILIKMGVYFQAQDDYLDCYGTPEQIGKIGTDIESKKCGFLFCNAYNGLTTPKITPEQKAMLDAKYGKCKVGSADEKAIKKLYDELNLEKQYQQYEWRRGCNGAARRPGLVQSRVARARARARGGLAPAALSAAHVLG